MWIEKCQDNNLTKILLTAIEKLLLNNAQARSDFESHSGVEILYQASKSKNYDIYKQVADIIEMVDFD